MAVDSILPKPELRFLFGLTAFSGEVFCIAFRGRHEAHFLFVFHWLAVWSKSETINSLSLLPDMQGERHLLRIRQNNREDECGYQKKQNCPYNILVNKEVNVW